MNERYAVILGNLGNTRAGCRKSRASRSLAPGRSTRPPGAMRRETSSGTSYGACPSSPIPFPGRSRDGGRTPRPTRLRARGQWSTPGKWWTSPWRWAATFSASGPARTATTTRWRRATGRSAPGSLSTSRCCAGSAPPTTAAGIRWTSTPNREKGYGAIRGSILYLEKLGAILDRVGTGAVTALIARRDAVATAEFVREHLIA